MNNIVPILNIYNNKDETLAEDYLKSTHIEGRLKCIIENIDSITQNTSVKDEILKIINLIIDEIKSMKKKIEFNKCIHQHMFIYKYGFNDQYQRIDNLIYAMDQMIKLCQR